MEAILNDVNWLEEKDLEFLMAKWTIDDIFRWLSARLQ